MKQSINTYTKEVLKQSSDVLSQSSQERYAICKKAAKDIEMQARVVVLNEAISEKRWSDATKLLKAFRAAGIFLYKGMYGDYHF